MRNDVTQMEAASRRQKDFETEHSGVFAPPGLTLAQFLTAQSVLDHKVDYKEKSDF